MTKATPIEQDTRAALRPGRITAWRMLVVFFALIFIGSLEVKAKEQDRSPAKDDSSKKHDDKKNSDDKDRDQKDKDGRGDKDHPKPPKPPRPPKGRDKGFAAPSQLAAQAVSLFQVNLTWKDNTTNELGFKIERSQDGKNFTQIAQVLPNTTTYRDLNRFPDTKYFYRARAFIAKGDSAYSAIARAQTPAPECKLSVLGNEFLSGGIMSPSLDNLNLVAAAGGGGWMPLVLTSEGKVFQVGVESALIVSNVSRVVAIASGRYHGLALIDDGRVVGWGDDYYGQATPPQGLSNVVAIAAGSIHSLALKNDGTVVAWGADFAWQSRPPTNLTGVVAISAGNLHSLALKSDGTVVGWGWNDQNAAQPPPALRDVIAISAGDSHSLALTSDNTVVRWGYFPTTLIPSNLGSIVGIATVQESSILLDSNGKIHFWQGWPENGSPVNLYTSPELTNVVAIGAGSYGIMPLASQASSPLELRLALRSANQIDLSWKDSSVSETGYIVERELIDLYGFYPSTREHLATLGANITNFVDSTVQVGKRYSYYVRSKNSCGESAFGASASITVSPPIDSPFLNFAYSQGTSAILSWYEQGVGALEYQIERADDVGGQPGVWNQIAVINPKTPAGDNLSFFGHTDPFLPANSTNWYRARTVNVLGMSPYSEPSKVVIVPPAKPHYLNAYIDTNGVRLNWGIVYDSRGGIGFRIERSTNASENFGIWKEIAVIPPTDTPVGEYTDTTAVSGSTNSYRIRAFTEAGTSDYSESTPVVLFAPTSPRVFTSTISDEVYLSASPPWPFNYAVGQFPVQFERADDVGGVPGTWIPITPESRPFQYGTTVRSSLVDKGLNINQAYWYRVKISTWLGDSPFSNPIQVTFTPPPPPVEVTARIGNTNHINLRWRNASGAHFWINGVQSFSYKVERTIDDGTSVINWIEIATVGPTNSTYSTYVDTVSGPGLTYRYRVCAFDVVGKSAYWETFPVTLIPPQQPTLGANVYINYVDLYWGISTAGTIGSRLERAPDVGGAPGAWAVIETTPPADIFQDTYRDTLPSLVAGYWYRVKIFNWLGDSDYSAPVFVQIQPPQAPTRLEARIGSTNQIRLSWSYFNGDADRFEFQRANIADGLIGTWETIIANYPQDVTLPWPTDTNVVALTEYAYRMRAGNAIGWSPYSEVSFIRTARPPAPIAGTTEYFGGRVTLNWYPSSDAYSYGEIGNYEVERAAVVAGVEGNWIRVYEGYSNSYTDNTPPAGSTCLYRIRTANWIGVSDYTTTTSVTITPPLAPHLAFAELGTNQVDLTIYTGHMGGHDGLRIDRASDVSGAPGIWEEIGVVVTNGGSVTFTDTNVFAYTTNWYRARAFHRAGLSDYSDAASVAAIPPPAPNQLTAGQFADRVTLNWRTDTSAEVGGFKLERAFDAGGIPGTWTQIAIVPATNSFCGWWYAGHIDSGLSVGTYWYRIRAYNWVGDSEFSESLAKVILGPTSPYVVNARIGTTNQVIISWYPGYEDVGGYYLERASNFGGVTSVWSHIATVFKTNALIVPNFADTNLVWYSTNLYRVRSFNVLGVSPYSEAISIGIVSPPAPVIFETTVLTDSIRLRWYFPSANYGEIAGGKLERARDNSGVPGIWDEINDIPLGEWWENYKETEDTNLMASGTYWYRLRSYNWLGYGEYSPATKVTFNGALMPSIAFSSVPLVAQLSTTNQDALLSWTATGGTTNVVEAATQLNGNFRPISPNIVLSGSGSVTTNFLDVGALTNSSSQFYRIRVVP